MCHLKSRNGCHRHKETNILPLIEFQPGFQLFLSFFLFFSQTSLLREVRRLWLGLIMYFAKVAFRLKVAALNFLNISLFILPVRDLVMQAALVLKVPMN